MPGIVGFLRKNLEEAPARAALLGMRDLLRHHASYHEDPLHIGPDICGGRTHPGVIQLQPQPQARGPLLLWLDGEIFNQDELKERYQIEAESDAALLCALYEEDKAFGFLKEIDGIFCAALYDSERRRLFLFCDRYGLRHLYFTFCQGRLAWASEYKAFLCLPGFSPRIDPRALEELSWLGFFLGDGTWLEGVELLSSGTLLTLALDTGAVTRRRYWWWDDIAPFSVPVGEEEAQEELLRLFRASVARRCEGEPKVGLLLSGGQDSRALLAAIPALDYPLHAITFGRKSCDDIRIAAWAARKKGAVHHIAQLSPSSWLKGRIEALWWTDGQLDLTHAHAVSALPLAEERFDVTLDGYLTDGILGGYYEGGPAPDMVRKIYNSGRRFVALGPKLLSTRLQPRFPFFENRLMEFTLKLPPQLRRGNRIYGGMLLKGYPAYFRHIPWQNTGMALGWPKGILPVVRRLRALRDALSARNPQGVLAQILGVSHYADYASWLRQEPARSLFDGLLRAPDALYPAYLSRPLTLRAWEEHLGGRDHSVLISRAVTTEIWLKQLFTGEHRPGADTPEGGRQAGPP